MSIACVRLHKQPIGEGHMCTTDADDCIRLTYACTSYANAAGGAARLTFVSHVPTPLHSFHVFI